MLSKIRTIGLNGIDAFVVTVEVAVIPKGLPIFEIVGLADKSVTESKQRIRSAFYASGIDFPNKKIIVNLAPSGRHKEGTNFDLPIAVGILCAVEKSILANISFDDLYFGELSLDGKLNATRGVFMASLLAEDLGCKKVYLPLASESLVGSTCHKAVFYGVDSLRDLRDALLGVKVLPVVPPLTAQVFQTGVTSYCELDGIAGCYQAKKALSVAYAGGHNILLTGTPGSGKTSLARASAFLQAPLDMHEFVEINKIYSCLGDTLVLARPFRSPHHTISYSGMIGGGAGVMPGEITMAHRGVLFLDEFNYFNSNILEALRQPMEDGLINISRSKVKVQFPCSFQLLATSNPCKCGYFGHPKIKCTCSEGDIRRYLARVSGPISDRIDMQIYVQSTEFDKILARTSKSTLVLQAKDLLSAVTLARDLQKKRYGTGLVKNAVLKLNDIKKFCALSPVGESLIKTAEKTFGLSSRASLKVIKLARTVADMAGCNKIKDTHVLEALSYRYKSLEKVQ